MPAPALNNVQTTDAYDDANTVVFIPPVLSFQLITSNKAIYYQLAIPGVGNSTDVTWESIEHYMVPSLSNFDADDAGKLGVNALAGIRVRSAVAGQPATVTVA